MQRGHNGKAHMQRRDATGHLNPQYAADLRKRSLESADKDTAVAFVERPRSADSLASTLGEEFVAAATGGDDVGLTELNEGVPEEEGGPFVITRAKDEFAMGRDRSNPRGATREPFPVASSEEPSGASDDDEEEGRRGAEEEEGD